MSKMISKLSKHDKKLIIIFSSIAAGLVFAIISAALVFSLSRRGDGSTESAENGEMPGVTIGSTRNSTTNMPIQEEFLDSFVAPTALGGLIIEATDSSGLGVAKDSGFMITSETVALTAEHLMEFLTVRSGEEFTLDERGENTFLLSFTEELETNKVFNLVYQPPGYSAASYAFQTADVFRITATTPGRGTHGIPENTGIEVTFSQALVNGVADFQNAFTIQPHVEGHFLQRDNTYIFAPTSALIFNTTYTVTINRGIAGITGDALAEEYSFSFATRWGAANMPLYSISGDAYETFLPWNEVFIALNVSRDFVGRNFTVNLYNLHNANNFINFTGTEAGTFLKEYETELLVFRGEYQNSNYLMLGETLSEGYYVAEIRSTERNVDIVVYKFIQVSPISVYSISVDGESVFWVHDAAEGQPAQGARISINGARAATTNNEGVAITETNSDSRAVITIEYGDYQPFAYFKPTYGDRAMTASDRFLSYIYTDRPSYRPNDTIDVFGVIMPRYGHSHSPSDVFTLRIGDMIQLPITLDSYNSFAIRVPVEDMFGYPEIRVLANGEAFMYTYISFYDYTNLSYVISGELDRVAYCPGDNANFEVRVTTFAGRAVEGASLSQGSAQPVFRTNSDGIASGSLPVSASAEAWHWRPHWSGFWFTVSGDAQISQGIDFPYIIVPSDVMLENELIDGTMTVTANEILVER
ncbi:MAG: Ig-like domain-containing protein, partial [Clostridiales bacterium]|nr:Ig-like domain-containing protein [Clostridiales bacterium]